MNDESTSSSAPLPLPVREIVTPAAAAEILEKTRLHGCNPRKLDSSHARRLARDMSNGSWDDYNPDVLSLCSHGAAIQGQHRLEAVIISKTPRSFLVARDLPHQTATTMDCGKARSAATALSLVGVERHRKDISSTVRLLRLYDAERNKVAWPAWRSVVYTNAEIVRFFQSEYLDLPDFLPLMAALKSGVYSAPAASLACAYLVHRDGESTSHADDFFQGLVSGAHLDTADPRWVVRRYFQNPVRPRRGNTVSSLQLGLLLKTWNLWVSGGAWEMAYFRPNERMPEVVRAGSARRFTEMQHESADPDNNKMSLSPRTARQARVPDQNINTAQVRS
ncbi:hypothetical protein [Streptomyces liliifuscus]|uniref:Uncharacterized protein n=1 Tax=Streptomyces liliifuscus TaxID=2797636 RepID=A0A7T7KVK4_9ACTN|nr:hypothetical protein [Streptomyces liliifuscus]QQM40310.1 hypothetical protein JEQ17_13075 [Streptomyces liliifuscus]